MKVHVWGTDFRRSSSEFRAKLLIPRENREARIAELCELGFADLVYVSTCNRIEFYTTAPDYFCDTRALWIKLLATFGLPPEAFYQGFHFEGKATLRHLIRVASSLESLVIGEAQVLGQLKESYAEAKATSRGVSSCLDQLFQFSFETAKRIRTESSLGEKSVSVASLGLQHVAAIEAEFPLQRAVVVGRSPMSTTVVQWLRKQRPAAEILWVNRNLEALENLLEADGIEKRSLADFLSDPGHFSHLFTATAATEPIFTETFFNKLHCQKRLLCDLAQPADICRTAEENPHLHVIRLENLQVQAAQNAEWRSGSVAAAERWIEEAIRDYCLAQKETPFLKDFSSHEPHLLAELELYLNEWRSEFPEEFAAKLRRFGEKLLKKSLHHSREHLKGVLRQVTEPRSLL